MTRNLIAILAATLSSVALVSAAPPEPIEGDSPAVAAARAQAATFEEAGFIFREDHWESTVTAEKGKAIRIQLFKGHEYRICVAAAPGTKTKLESHVVDASGKPIENENVAGEEGTTVNLRVSPKKTGVHLITVLQKDTPEAQCALVIGYR